MTLNQKLLDVDAEPIGNKVNPTISILIYMNQNAFVFLMLAGLLMKM